MMKNKIARFLAVLLVAILTAGSANAEITTVANNVGDVTGSFAGFSTKETPCFVREPTMFGNGGASPLSSLFAEMGIIVAKDDSAPCEIDYRGFVSRHLNEDETSKVVTTAIDWFYQYPEYQDRIPKVGPAIQGGNSATETEKLADDAVASTKPQHARGESTGAALGGSLLNSVGAAAGGAILGSLFDSTKQPPAGVGHIKAEIIFKNGKDKPARMVIEVNSASTTKERPVDLLNAVVKRLVVEIQAKEDALKKADAVKAGAPAAVAVSNSEAQK